jgi:cyanophycin synthetase
VVYSAAGDRRDVDMVRQGELLGEAFDRIVLYEDHYLRGRASGDIMRLFRQGTGRATRVSEVVEVQGALKAVEAALRAVRPGELLLIQADKIGETVDFVRHYLASRSAGHEIDLNEALIAPLSPQPTPAPVPMAVAAVLAAESID